MIPFGPTNAPAFYTSMMKDFKGEWDTVFILTISKMEGHKSFPIILTADYNIMICGRKLILGSKTSINNILLWCDVQECSIISFEYVCKVFQKYRVSFRLDKCEFLKSRVECVVHDILRKYSSPAQSQCNLIRDWKLPTTGQSFPPPLIYLTYTTANHLIWK